MKSSDYIVEFFADKGIKDFFGYQGTMIAHFADAVERSSQVTNHCSYNEQGAAFAAVGYAKASGRCALAYATSGPGAANLVSGIADAYFDSTPVIFITGQLNTYEYLGIEGVRQNGFQEMDVVSTVSAITKYAVKVENKDDIRYILEKAWYIANNGRQGPVVIDLPMDMQRQEIEHEQMRGFDPAEMEQEPAASADTDAVTADIMSALKKAKAPVFLLGNGIIRGSETHRAIIGLAEKLDVPVLTSMLARDLLPYEHRLNFGHIGSAYGHRYANMIIYKKADLVICLGCSLCKRQVSMYNEKFAENARIIRVDIDEHELARKIHKDETGYLADCNEVIRKMTESDVSDFGSYEDWIRRCNEIKDKLEAFDRTYKERDPNHLIEEVSMHTPDGTAVCADVGQHQVWTSQSFLLKPHQTMIFSGGHGAMGFALPAAIGAHFGVQDRALAICGDGAMQMNIQELQWVFREQLPVTIIVMNNSSLGLIRQQQDDMLDSRYAGAAPSGGYTTPDFCAVAKAYGIPAAKVCSKEEIEAVMKELDVNGPRLIEIQVSEDSMAYPKTNFGEEMFDQRPYMPKGLLDEILKI